MDECTGATPNTGIEPSRKSIGLISRRNLRKSDDWHAHEDANANESIRDKAFEAATPRKN